MPEKKPRKPVDFFLEAAELVEWCQEAVEQLLPELDDTYIHPWGNRTAKNAMIELIRRLARLGQAETIRQIDLEKTWTAKDAIAELVQTSVLVKRVLQENPQPDRKSHIDAAPSKEPKAAKPSNGPVPPNILGFEGKTVVLEPIPWKLVEFMWNRESALSSQVCRHVWGESRELMPEHALKIAQQKANKALTTIGASWRLGLKNGYVVKKTARKGI